MIEFSDFFAAFCRLKPKIIPKKFFHRLRRKNRNIISAVTIAATVILIQPIANALMADEIERIGSQITVLIDGINPGSGVLISRQGNNYYVLTAKHVVATEDEYTIIAPDGRQYQIDYKKVVKLPDLDLAIAQFVSNENYQLATFANYDYDANFQHIFIYGWPQSQSTNSQTKPLFNAGLLISTDYKLAFIKDTISQGYELFYTNITQLGLSGSPLLDTVGRVIGIHGASEGTQIYDPRSRSLMRVNLGFSSGIPINRFFKMTKELGMRLRLKVENLPPPQLTRQEAISIEAYLTVPESGDSSSAIAWANQGNQLYRLERFEEALASFNRAIELKADFYPAWYGRGNVLSSLGRFDEAIAAYQRTTQIQPDFYLAWRDRGALLGNLERYREALESFDRARELKPDDFVVWYIRGNLLTINLQKHEEAIAAYDRSLELKSDFADAWTARGEAFYHLGRYDEAMNSFKNAIFQDDKQAIAWAYIGAISLELKQYAEALVALDRAINLRRNDEQLWFLKAVTFLANYEHEKAREAALEALQIKPNDPEILNFIHAIDGNALPPNYQHQERSPYRRRHQ